MTDDELDGLEHLVKPLEWRDSYGVWRSETPFGDYIATGKILKIGTLAMSPEVVCDDPRAAAQADYTRRILSALNLDALRSPPADVGPWRTVERLPVKPGLRSYEHVPCLIYARGEWEIGMWNCEHLVWDDAEGDDFRYHPTEPTHWMFLPAPPRALAETTKGDDPSTET